MPEIASKKTRDQVKIRVIHFRSDPVIQKMEFDSFVRFTKLRPEQLVVHNALTDPVTTDLIDGFDGLLIAGGGDVRVTEELPFWEPVRKLLRHAYEINFPTLGVCLGIQLAAQEFGGKLTSDKKYFETGTYPMYLTDAAKNDPMYQGIPEIFNGQMGHNDTVIEIPAEAVHLTYSDRSKYQAFCFPGKKMYFTQYHPELDEHQLRERLYYYEEHYADNKEEFQAILNTLQDFTDASLILERFVDVLVLDSEAVCGM